MNMLRSTLMFLLGAAFTAGMLTVGQVSAQKVRAVESGDCVQSPEIDKLSPEEYHRLYGSG